MLASSLNPSPFLSSVQPLEATRGQPARVGDEPHGRARGAVAARVSSSVNSSDEHSATASSSSSSIASSLSNGAGDSSIPSDLSRRALLSSSLVASMAAVLTLALPYSLPAPAYAAEIASDIEAPLRAAIRKVVTKAKAPGALRIVFHDAGTYDVATNTGGMNGSVRFELKRPESDGLYRTMKVLLKVRKELGPLSDAVSWADLMALAGAEAVLLCGGPSIPVRLGRIDASVPDAEHRMPAETLNATEVVASFQSKGFDVSETVVLLGAHTLGGKGFGDPTSFDNSYFSLLLTRPWLNKNDGMADMIGLPSDRAIVEDEECVRWIRAYAADQDLFFRDFARAYTKLVDSGAVFA